MHLLDLGISISWIVYGTVWIIGMFFSKPVQRRTSPMHRFVQLSALFTSSMLIAGHAFRGTWLETQLWPALLPVHALGLLFTAGGAAFAIWARLTLGTNWSGQPMVKQQHELITRGPYALARHPIYTGLISAFLGTALVIGQVRGVLAVLLITVALWFKLRLEEELMLATFPDSYPAYRQRVKALVPGIL